MRFSADCTSCGWEVSLLAFLRAFSWRVPCPLCRRVVSLRG
ncbi:MAG: hypothetical protein SF051_15495 [Elusimicrobiota bacterium]|nr:hypothetical protein [Elusimicrobiota bacterium]